MALTTDDIKSIAHLARLGVDEDSLQPLAEDLSTMLNLVEQLQAVDTTGVEPMAHPASASLLLRDDEVSEPNQRETLQAPAPSTQDGYFLVPRVIE
ncbi:MAG: Asp-tRNA(Asn)/Glu-tRNA(Gln) amidotransferase subunit GatC [Granulosicoccus sp.]